MNNDLISREALKEDFKSRLAKCNKWIEKAKDKETKIRASAVKSFICEVIMTIDNAPTVSQVTVFCENADEKTIEELKAELERVMTELKPQGEWKDHSEDGYVECPFCEHLTTCEDNIDELHYCWNCGAKLRKGGAE